MVPALPRLLAKQLRIPQPRNQAQPRSFAQPDKFGTVFSVR
jgi:hypothetical protein